MKLIVEVHVRRESRSISMFKDFTRIFCPSSELVVSSKRTLNVFLSSLSILNFELHAPFLRCNFANKFCSLSCADRRHDQGTPHFE